MYYGKQTFCSIWRDWTAFTTYQPIGLVCLGHAVKRRCHHYEWFYDIIKHHQQTILVYILDHLAYHWWIRKWHRLYNTLFTLWGLHVLPGALQMPARSSAFSIRNTYKLFAASLQQTHSLHLRMLLDPHNRQHLNSKTWKTLPSLFVRLISYDIKCTSWRSLYSGQSFDHICLWRVDMSGMILAFCSSLSTDMTLTFQVPRKFRLNISRKIS